MLAKKLQRISVVEIGGLLKVLRGHRIILRYALAVSKRANNWFVIAIAGATSGSRFSMDSGAR
jgi:hypothetical protein